jgi:hypothetical protein
MVHSLNDEQLVFFDDILYKNKMYPNESLSIFLTEGVGTRKTFTLMVIIQGLIQYYLKQNKDLNRSKQKIKKMAIHMKSCI